MLPSRRPGRFPPRLVAACVLTAAVLLLAAPARSRELVVGMSAAFSGSTRGLGIELFRGSMAYLSRVNMEGGVHGNTIRLLPMDDGYNPVPAIKNTIRFVERENAFLLFDYVGTPTVTRVLPLLKTYRDRHIQLFFPFTGAQPQREEPYGDYCFNLRASYQQEVEGLVEHFIAQGRKRIAVFYQIDAYGRSGWGGVKRTLARYGLTMAAEATYRRGTAFDHSMAEQVRIIQESEPDAVVSVGAYAACAAFIRDARDMGLDVPISNVSFADSENILRLLKSTEKATGRSYTANLINSQVVPSYRDTSLPAVAEYRRLMEATPVMPPRHLVRQDYTPQPYSPVSLEGFLNAKLLVHILRLMGPDPKRSEIAATVESIKDYDLGIGHHVSFGPDRHQGLDKVFYTTVRDGLWVSLSDWSRWRK